MHFTPHLKGLHNHTNFQLSVTVSFLRDIVWCSLHEFDVEFMFLSFDNLLKICLAIPFPYTTHGKSL